MTRELDRSSHELFPIFDAPPSRSLSDAAAISSTTGRTSAQAASFLRAAVDLNLDGVDDAVGDTVIFISNP